jgi:SWI/SNF-related matrix-associated actin-dependent regulator 1 of chromatin subfamily A
VPKLFDFQHEGAKFLSTRRGAILADEMGLGKSAQAITAADDLVANRILVLCPAVARINWQREFAKFSIFHRPITVISHGRQPHPPQHHSIVVSYELAVKKWQRGDFKDDRFDIAIIDEAHFCKNTRAKRTLAVTGRQGLIRQATRTWALSGTPMPNHPGELWVWLYTFGATKLEYDDYCERYCEYAWGQGHYDPFPQIVGAAPDKIRELKLLASRVMLRRRKKDVLKQLPPIFFQEVTVERGPVDLEALGVDPIALKAQEETVQKILDQNQMQILELQAGSVSTLRRFCGLQKVKSTIHLVHEELASQQYKKLVVFCVHRQVAELLHAAFEKHGAVLVYGSTTMQARQVAIDRFQRDPMCKVFIGNIKAAGTAITLTASHQVLFVEQEWTPGDNAQAVMRCHRIGQLNTVTARFVMLSDSIDEKIAAILRRKTQDICEVLGDAPQREKVVDEFIARAD